MEGGNELGYEAIGDETLGGRRLGKEVTHFR